MNAYALSTPVRCVRLVLNAPEKRRTHSCAYSSVPDFLLLFLFIYLSLSISECIISPHRTQFTLASHRIASILILVFLLECAMLLLGMCVYTYVHAHTECKVYLLCLSLCMPSEAFYSVYRSSYSNLSFFLSSSLTVSID